MRSLYVYSAEHACCPMPSILSPPGSGLGSNLGSDAVACEWCPGSLWCTPDASQQRAWLERHCIVHLMPPGTDRY
jgi:hypothetical protein